MRSLWAFLLLIFPSLACGASTSPSGGVETFQLQLDGRAFPFDTVTGGGTSRGDHVVRLQFVASAGCDGTQIDGCAAYTLTLDLDAVAATGAPLVIDGTTTYTIDPTTGQYPFSFAPTSHGSSAVKGVGLMTNCSPCSPKGTYLQSFTGTLTLRSASTTAVVGTLHLESTGKIPNEWNDRTAAVIDADFDVSVR